MINQVETVYKQSLYQEYRYQINNAINAIMQLNAVYLMEIDPLNLTYEQKKELELECNEYNFKCAINQMMQLANDLKKIDDYLSGKIKLKEGEVSDVE